MGRRVIATNRPPPFRVDLGPRRLALSRKPLRDDAAMHVDIRRRLEGIVDVDKPGVAADPAGVPDLPARFAVERRAVQNDFDRVASLGLRYRSIRTDESEVAVPADGERPLRLAAGLLITLAGAAVLIWVLYQLTG